MRFKHLSRAFVFDSMNRLRYGSGAPRYAERVWIEPDRCNDYVSPKAIKKLTKLRLRQSSGVVVKSPWPSVDVFPVNSLEKMVYCFSHWSEGLSWEDYCAECFMLDKIAKFGRYDECADLQDVKKRFEGLDVVFNEIKNSGGFKVRDRIRKGGFRESGGVLIHIGADGVPFFSGAGCHRFAMAKILNLPFPAQIGCVHESAIPYLSVLRKRPLS